MLAAAAGECGIDAVDIARFRASCERWGDRLLQRVFTDAERARVGHQTHRLAARFAAKEAVVKALGTGIGAIGWRDVEIAADTAGKPVVLLHGPAAAAAAARGLVAWSVSLTHTETTAIAMAVAWRTASETGA